jgi:hypothetical protein
MGDMVIVAYRPKPGGEEALLALVRDHVPRLRRLGLATDRPNLAMRGQDGTLLEVFEWREGGIEAAHQLPEIHAMWAEYGAVCDFLTLRDLPEAVSLFAQFVPIDV